MLLSSPALKSIFLKCLPPLIILLLPVLFLDQLFFENKTFFLRDFTSLDLPGRLWIADSLRHGIIPFWCSLTQCGVPAAGQPLFGVFYPLNWIYLLSNVELAIRIWFALHLAVAGLSFYAFAREWRFVIAAAMFGAISFMFSMYVVTWMEFAHGFCSMVWGPLGLFFITRIVLRSVGQKGRVGFGALVAQNGFSLVGFGVVSALQILASGEFFYYATLFNSAYILFLWIAFGNLRGALKSALLLAASGLVGVAMSMPQLALTLELVSFSDRSSNMDSLAAICSAHPLVFLTFLAPYLFGFPGYPSAYWAPQIYEFALGGCYVGVIPILSAFFVGVLFRRKLKGRYLRLALFFLIVGAAGLIMAAGKFTPVYGFMHGWFPGLTHLRFPTKFFLFTTYAAVGLGMVGIQVLLLSGTKRLGRLRISLIGSVTVGAMVCLGYLWVQFNHGLPVWLTGAAAPSAAEHFSPVLRDLKISALFCLLTLGFFGLRIWWRLPLFSLSAGLLVAVFLNLWIVGRQVHPAVESGIHERTTERLQREIPHDQLYRVASTYEMIQQWLYGERRIEIIDWARESFGMAYWFRSNIPTVATCATSLARYRTLYNLLWGSEYSEKLADLLCVRYVIAGNPYQAILWQGAPRDFKIFQRPTARPRVFLVGDWKVAHDDQTALQTMLDPGFDPSRECVISTDQFIAAPEFWSRRCDPDAVKKFTDLQNEVDLEVSVADRSLLVLEDSWFPGWRAIVDGAEQPIYRVNYMFRGVFLPEGVHHVSFVYRPTHWTLGVCSFVFSVFCCLALLIWPALKNSFRKERLV